MMNQNKKFIRLFWIALFGWYVIPTYVYALTTLAKNDPFPVFNTYDPTNFLLTKEIESYLDPEGYDGKPQFIGLSVGVFGQNANRGRMYGGKGILGGVPLNLTDLEGRPNMITLLYGPLPAGATLPPTLLAARNALFPGVVGPINDPTLVDPDQLFGYFSFPTKYRKKGIRFDLSTNIYHGFGLKIEGGVASLSQTMTCTPMNLTCIAQPDCPFSFTPLEQTNVQFFLMEQLKAIAAEINLNLDNFQKTEFEELRVSLYWRHIYDMNADNQNWPDVLFIPYLTLGGSVSPSGHRNPNEFFALPFGNNSHPAVFFKAGLDLNFLESIEIGGEVGITHFFSRNICNFRVPNNPCQTGFFPFTTNVCYEPGQNWYFAAKMFAYHFLDRLSIWFQYVIEEHKEDRIKLNEPDPAFLPEVLEERSRWKTKFANIGFTYDISPNVGLGFVWQTPFSSRNTFQSTTVLFSIYGTY
jgi:hypothetical protein